MPKSNNRLIADLLSNNADEQLIFEGSTHDNNETVIRVTDPTADRTITYPDDSGVVALTKNTVSNTVFQSSLANTNVAISTESGRVDLVNTNLTGTNTAIRSLVTTESARVDVLNTNLTATNTAIRTLVSTESARVDVLNTNLTATNTAIRTLVSDRMQVSNTTLLVNDRMQVSNVQSYIANTNSRLTVLEAETGIEGGGFVLGTLTTFPGAEGNFDYLTGGSSNETYVGSTGESGSDAFGISLQSVYDNMDPLGRLVTEDLGTL